MRDLRCQNTIVGDRFRTTGAVSVACGLVMLLGGIAQANPTVCMPPIVAGQEWRSRAPDAQCDVAVAGEAEKVCKAWVATCKKAVRGAATCRNTELSAGEKLSKAECKLSAVADRSQCKKDAAAHKKILKASVKADKTTAQATCESDFPNCVIECNLD